MADIQKDIEAYLKLEKRKAPATCEVCLYTSEGKKSGKEFYEVLTHKNKQETKTRHRLILAEAQRVLFRAAQEHRDVSVKQALLDARERYPNPR